MSQRKEMIHIFDSIINFNYLSRYSHTLSKLFYKNCFKDYVSSLNNPENIETFRKFKNNDEIKNIKKNSTLISLDKEQKEKKELNLLIDDGNDDKKDNLIKKGQKMKSKKRIKIFSKTIDSLDPFKYHPNYNSIFKNIHSYKIVEHKTLSLKSRNGKNNKIKKHNLKIKDLNLNFDNDLISSYKKNSEEYKSCSSDSTITTNKKKFKSTLYKSLPDLNKQIKESKIKTETKFSFNNTRRFSKYTPRKANIYKVNNKITYIEPYKYSFVNKKNATIDFKKMAKRNSKFLIQNQILKNPSIYNYHPKYDLIEQRLSNIFFNKEDIPRRTKKYMLKKLWGSSRVVKDYLLIDNSKLNNDIKIKLQN